MNGRAARRRLVGWLVAALVTTVPSCTGNGAHTSPASTGQSSAAGTGVATTTGPPAAVPVTTATPSVGATPPGRSTRSTGDGTCVAGRCYLVAGTHQLPAGVAPESSGIAASGTVPSAFFVVDDGHGPGVSRIEAVRQDGSLLADLTIAGMSARNPEALSAGPCGSRAGRCLYIGDIGDNSAKRKSITVYRLDEPSLAPAPRGELPADAWRYTYPDGPHNAEAMVVLADGSMLVLTKPTPDPTSGVVPEHRIYRAPAGGGVLSYLSSYRPPEPAKAVQSLFTGTVVTDASYTPGRMLLLTYDEVVEYRAPNAAADPETFPSWPHSELPAPPMIQSEGITADLTGCGYEVTSEEGPGGDRAGLAGVTCQ